MKASQSKAPAPAKAGAGHFKWLRHVLAFTVLLSTGALIAQARETTVAVYRDGPPLGFSGGFGEDHCQACHNSEKLNVPPGSLTISVPERYSPGKVYPITVTLRRPGMKFGGFMLTARFEKDSTQAGTLALGDGQQGRIKILNDRDVLYALHSRTGTVLTGAGVNRWTLRWTAPAGKEVVIFNVAANAANGDSTNSGDFIYTSRARIRAR